MGDNKAHSYSDTRRILTQPQLEKVTEQELSISLRKEIDESFDHIYNQEIHLTQEERARWNRMDSLKAVQQQGLLFTAKEKKKLAGIEEYANKYTHPKYNSLDTSKTYMVLTIDSNGHIVYGDNPSRVDVDANESLHLNGKDTSFFMKSADPMVTSAPTIRTIEDFTTDNKNQAVNVKTMKNYCIASSYYVSDSLDIVENKIRFDSASNMFYYNKDRGWVQLNKTSNIDRDDEGKIAEKYFRSKMTPYPVGVILPQFSLSSYSDAQLRALGFLQLDGSLLKRSDYPELWNYINDPDNGTYLVSDDLWSVYLQYNGACGFFSTGDGSTTFRLPQLSNVEPRNYKTTDDGIPLGMVYGDAYPASDATGFHPYGVNTYKLSSFYYPILNYQPSTIYVDNQNTDEDKAAINVLTDTVFAKYRDQFKGIFQPGFPTADTVFSLYGNPYMTYGHDGTAFKLTKIHEYPNPDFDPDDPKSDEILTEKIEFFQEHFEDDPIYQTTGEDDISFDPILYKQIAGTMDAQQLSLTRTNLSDLVVPTTEQTFSDYSKTTAVTNNLYVGKLDAEYNIYDGQYVYGRSHGTSNKDDAYIYNLKSATEGYYKIAYDTISVDDEIKDSAIIYHVPDADTLTKIKTDKTHKFIIAFNTADDKTRILSALDAVTNTTKTTEFLRMNFIYYTDSATYEVFSPALYLTKDSAISLKTLITSMSTTDGLLCHFDIDDTHLPEIVVESKTALTKIYADLSPKNLNLSYSNEAYIGVISETSFTRLVRNNVSNTAIALPEVYKFDNGCNGTEFSYNYLITQFYIKAK